MAGRIALILAMVAALSIWPARATRAQTPPEEGGGVAQLPSPSPHWGFAYSLAALGSFSPSTVTIIDGDSRRVLGMLDGGLGSGFAISPDHREFYMADTFYSRGSRGKRTDVVTIYDAKTLDPKGEVVIPPKRQLAAQDNATTSVTPDGRFILVANMTPATSATVVDLQSRKVAGEIELTGCTEVLVTGNRQFVSLCGDGSMMTTDFDDSAKATSQKRTAKPFFDPDKDPVYALPAVIGSQAYFLSYHGTIYPVDLSTDPATPGKSWPLLTAAEAKDGWRPGGVQQLAVYRKRGLLYVLIHQGGEWTHKEPGKEVWVYDVKTQKRVRKIALDRAVDAIMTTQDDHPLLFAEMQTMPTMGILGYVQIYSALDGKLRGTVENELAIFEHLYGL